MKRRVIQIAGSTQLVSLPRKWALAQGIKKGDEIDVMEDGDKIVIKIDAKPEIKKKVLEVSKVDNLFTRMLAALYKAGYEEIELHFSATPPYTKIAEELKKHFPGFEILEQSSDHCVIKSISEEQMSEFEPTLRRIFLITISMAKNMIETLKDPKKANIEQFVTLEQTNNRFTNFCERLLNRSGYTTPRNSNLMYTIIWELEKIADELKYLAQYITENNIKGGIAPDTIENFKKSTLMFDKFYEVFYRYDVGLLHDINSLRKEVMEWANQAHRTKKNAELKMIHHIVNITQMVYNMVGCYITLKS